MPVVQVLMLSMILIVVLLILYLFPGSLLGCLLYDDCNLQPQITSDYIVSSNHFYSFILISIIYGILFLVATYGLYMAFDRGPVFVAAPIICSYPILSLIYAAVLTTSPKPHQWLLSLIVVFGIFLTVYTKKENTDKVKTVKLETIYWSILSAVFFSLSFQLGQNQIINSNEIISNLIARTSSIMVIVFLFANHIKFKSIKLNYKIILILMGVVDTLALLIMVYSGNFNHPEFSSVSASTFGLITILLVCFFYKEICQSKATLGETTTPVLA